MCGGCQNYISQNAMLTLLTAKHFGNCSPPKRCAHNSQHALEPEPCGGKGTLVRHVGKKDRHLPRLAAGTSKPILGTTIPGGLCARGRAGSSAGSPLSRWVPGPLPELEPPSRRGTGAAGVRTGVAMVTGARSRRGREAGGSTRGYWRLGWALATPPPTAAVRWSGPGAGFGTGADPRPVRGELSRGSGRRGAPGGLSPWGMGDQVLRGEGFAGERRWR